MKVAALILAHKNASQLKRLVDALRHPLVDVYVHLDKKSSLSPSDLRHLNVCFTEKRLDVALFDLSMVDAEIELIRTALARGQYDYFVLLSGQCYPLRHINDILNFLSEAYPKPFIEIISPKVVTRFARHFRYSHTMKRFRTASESFLKECLPTKSIYPYKYVSEGIAFAATLAKSLTIRSPKKRLRAMGLDPYFGPQWWILPNEAIVEMLRFYQDEAFRECIKDCFSCDEAFPQTVLMANPDRFGISLSGEGRYENKMWFTIFSHGHPIVLTEDYFHQLEYSGKLFARKFDEEVDSVVLDMIDKRSAELLGEKIQV